MHNSGMLVTPSGMAPASRRRCTVTQSSVATTLRRETSPDVFGMPSNAKFSLIVQGTPCSGGRCLVSPDWTQRSAASASARARRKRSLTIALITGFTRSICAIWASTACLEVISPLRIRRASSAAEAVSNSFIGVRGNPTLPDSVATVRVDLRIHPHLFLCVPRLTERQQIEMHHFEATGPDAVRLQPLGWQSEGV